MPTEQNSREGVARLMEKLGSIIGYRERAQKQQPQSEWIPDLSLKSFLHLLNRHYCSNHESVPTTLYLILATKYNTYRNTELSKNQLCTRCVFLRLKSKSRSGVELFIDFFQVFAVYVGVYLCCGDRDVA